MDAKTSIKSGLPSGHMTVGSERVAALSASIDVALHLPTVATERHIQFDVAEIFKKTPYVSDLKPSGRYVAKDMIEVGGMPPLMKMLLDDGHLHGNCLTVTGLTIAETLTSVKRNSHQIGVRSADKPVGTLNVKLTDAELAERKTRWRPRATNHTSGALWKYAQQVGSAVDGAVTRPGGAHEKQCYADI